MQRTFLYLKNSVDLFAFIVLKVITKKKNVQGVTVPQNMKVERRYKGRPWFLKQCAAFICQNNYMSNSWSKGTVSWKLNPQRPSRQILNILWYFLLQKTLYLIFSFNLIFKLLINFQTLVCVMSLEISIFIIIFDNACFYCRLKQ